jgi:uncharacterized protein (TIGR02147 family)
MKSVFEHRSYREYLIALEGSRPREGWGFRSQIAQAIHCQAAYVSRIFQGKTELSLEQAESLNEFLGHTEEEADFFILLVEHARAGKASLRSRFSRRIGEAVERHLVIKDRFKVKRTIQSGDQVIYYSAWYYAAIHVALSIPELRTKESLSLRLGLPMSKVGEVLSFLVSVGLASESGGKYTIRESRIHLGTDSPILGKHLTNWRLQAIQNFDRAAQGENLHYSGIITLSRSDILRVRGLIVKALEAANKIVADSPEEELSCMSIDFFRV